MHLSRCATLTGWNLDARRTAGNPGIGGRIYPSMRSARFHDSHGHAGGWACSKRPWLGLSQPFPRPASLTHVRRHRSWQGNLPWPEGIPGASATSPGGPRAAEGCAPLWSGNGPGRLHDAPVGLSRSTCHGPLPSRSLPAPTRHRHCHGLAMGDQRGPTPGPGECLIGPTQHQPGRPGSISPQTPRGWSGFGPWLSLDRGGKTASCSPASPGPRRIIRSQGLEGSSGRA